MSIILSPKKNIRGRPFDIQRGLGFYVWIIVFICFAKNQIICFRTGTDQIIFVCSLRDYFIIIISPIVLWAR